MRTTLTFIAIVLMNTALFAQTDTTAIQQNENVEIYDVVAIYREHSDGRGKTQKFTSEMRGEIVKYDESTGVLTFKSRDGRMYSLTPDQYEYFQYDKEFTSKKKVKKQKELKPRKDSGLEYTIGLSAGALNLPTGFKPDYTYINGSTAAFAPFVCLKLGVSNYLNSNSAIGITGEYSLVTSDLTYFNVGARYQYIYNPTKNSAFYFPLELKFGHYKGEDFYQVDETVYTPGGSYWPKEFIADVTLNSVELNLGQGVSFALKNKRSISLELILLNQFIISEKVEIDYDFPPTTKYRGNGLRLNLTMNF